MPWEPLGRCKTSVSYATLVNMPCLRTWVPYASSSMIQRTTIDVVKLRLLHAGLLVVACIFGGAADVLNSVFLHRTVAIDGSEDEAGEETGAKLSNAGSRSSLLRRPARESTIQRALVTHVAGPDFAANVPGCSARSILFGAGVFQRC